MRSYPSSGRTHAPVAFSTLAIPAPQARSFALPALDDLPLLVHVSTPVKPPPPTTARPRMPREFREAARGFIRQTDR